MKQFKMFLYKFSVEVLFCLITISLLNFCELKAEINEGLIAYYPFTGNADDYSGKNNHCTVHGAMLSYDKWLNSDSAYFFDGSDDYIQCPRTSDFNVSSSASYIFWIKYQKNGFIFNKWVWGKEDKWIYCNDSGLNFQLYPKGTITSKSSLPKNEWTHVAIIFNNPKVEIYVNGNLDKSGNLKSGSVYNSNGWPYFGRAPGRPHSSGGSNEQPYKGFLDEIRIYDRSLSQEEVMSIYLANEKEDLIEDVEFRPDPNGWNFPNLPQYAWPTNWWKQFDYSYPKYPLEFSEEPVNAESSDFPDWPLFVETFGEENCYVHFLPTIKVIRPSALRKWNNIKNTWGGSCFGFAISSLMTYNFVNEMTTHVPYLQNTNIEFENIFNFDINNDIRKCINSTYLYQFFPDQLNYIRNNRSKKPITTLEEISDMFNIGLINRALILFNQSGSGGGHAVVPYKVTNNPNLPSNSFVYVYDNNFPNDFERKISINSDNNTWSYFASTNSAGNFVDWGGDKGLFLTTDLNYYYNYSKINPNKRKIQKSNEYFEIYNSSNANVSIINQNGDTIGYSLEGTIINTLDSGMPIIPINGTIAPPIGYYVPVNDYLIEVNNSLDTNNRISIVSANTVFNFNRPYILENQTDQISINQESNIIVIYNDNNIEIPFNIESISHEASIEKVVVINNYKLLKDNIAKIDASKVDRIIIENRGVDTVYDLSFKSLGNEKKMNFVHKNIQIVSQTSQEIVPNWNDLEKIDVLVNIDNNLDGTIDDSIKIQNEGIYATIEPSSTNTSSEYGSITFTININEQSEYTDYTAFSNDSWIIINNIDYQNNRVSATYDTNTESNRIGSITVKLTDSKEGTTSQYLFKINQSSDALTIQSNKNTKEEDSGGCFIQSIYLFSHKK